MEITVNVGNVDLNTIIGDQMEYDDEGDCRSVGGVTIADAVVAEIVKGLRVSDQYKSLGARVKEIRDEVIRERIKTEVDKAFEKPITKTNSYGEPTGQTVTLTELIVAEVSKFLTEKVDRSGRSDYSGKPRASQFLAEAVDKAMKQELAEAIVSEKAKVVAAVRAKAADLIAEAVKQGIGR